MMSVATSSTYTAALMSPFVRSRRLVFIVFVFSADMPANQRPRARSDATFIVYTLTFWPWLSSRPGSLRRTLSVNML